MMMTWQGTFNYINIGQDDIVPFVLGPKCETVTKLNLHLWDKLIQIPHGAAFEISWSLWYNTKHEFW